MPIYRVTDAGGGVNKDALPSELAPGMWSDCTNVRFMDGFAQSRRGFKTASAACTTQPYFLSTYTTSSSDRYIVAAGTTRVFVHDGVASETELTRYTDGKVVSSITRVGTTATLTTSTAHGLSSGNSVTVYGVTNETLYNGTFSITVTSSTTFTYTMSGTPGGAATVTSAVGYEYRVQNNFTGAIDDKWTGGSFNGIMVLNNPVDGMYYWAGDTSIRLRRMPAWPAGQKCDAIFFFKNYIIALAPTVDGVRNEQQFLWGSAAEPGSLPASWTAASTNDAGDSPLPAETGGALVDGATFGDLAFVFDQDACYGLQYIGGNDVFRVFRLPGVEGVLARHCIARTPKGLVYLANGDVKLFNGVTADSIAQGRMRKWLRNEIGNHAQRCCVVAHPLYSEVWVCFPGSGEEVLTRAAVWNWDSDTWGIFELLDLTALTTGLIQDGLTDTTWADDTETWAEDSTTWNQTDLSAQQIQLLAATSSNLVGSIRIGVADASTTDFGQTLGSGLTRLGISAGDPDRYKSPIATRWHIDATAGTTFSISISTSKTADGDPQHGGSATLTQGTTNWLTRWVYAGRYINLTFSPAAGTQFSLRSYEIDYKRQGRH